MSKTRSMIDKVNDLFGSNEEIMENEAPKPRPIRMIMETRTINGEIYIKATSVLNFLETQAGVISPLKGGDFLRDIADQIRKWGTKDERN